MAEWDLNPSRLERVQVLLKDQGLGDKVDAILTEWGGIQFVARTNIEPGELVLESEGVGTVPLRQHEPSTCSHCFTLAERKRLPSQCSSCKMAFCSSECELKGHDKVLCDSFTKLKEFCSLKRKQAEKKARKKNFLEGREIIDEMDWDEVLNDSRMIAKLICGSPKELEQVSSLLCDNFNKHSPEVSELADRVVDAVCFAVPLDSLQSLYVLGHEGESEVPSSKHFLKRLVYQTYCNRFSFIDTGLEMYAMSVSIPASFLNHSCFPNVTRAVSKTKIQFWSFRTILAGECLLYAYEDLTLQRLTRRKYLKLNYYFDCCCERCSQLEDDLSDLQSCLCNGCAKPFVVVKDSRTEIEARAGCLCSRMP
jgi:hypothetical protein